MVITPVELWPETQVPTGVTVLYTAPTTSNGAAIKRAVFTNTGAVARTITVYKVPPSGSPGGGNALISAYSVAAGEDYVPQSMINMILRPGGSIQALADTGGIVNTTASGFTF
jgi:hypothetical protein